jgi:hypothetical protein
VFLLQGAVEKTELVELLKRDGDRRPRGVGVDLEGLDELVCDVLTRRVTITSLPDEAGRLIEVMNQVCLAVQNHHLTFEKAGVDIGSASRAVRHSGAQKFQKMPSSAFSMIH